VDILWPYKLIIVGMESAPAAGGGPQGFSRGYDRWNRLLSEPKERPDEYKVLNGMLFLVFAVPTTLALLAFGGRGMGFAYYMVAVWVHEAGHGFWCLFGWRLLCAFGGTFNELLFSAVPALICLRKREIYLAGCVFMMCASLSVENAGAYMQSARYPSGFGFAGVRMTEATHDWNVIFRELGVLEHSYRIGGYAEAFGSALAVILLAASLLGFIPVMSGWVPGGLMDLVSPGAAASALYFLVSGGGGVQLAVSALLSIPFILKAVKFVREGYPDVGDGAGS